MKAGKASTESGQQAATDAQSPLQEAIKTDRSRAASRVADELLGTMLQSDQLVGDVVSMGYEAATVLIHDHFRKQVGGIPSLSFLVATRLQPGQSFDFQREDASIILLRVLDAAPLPDHQEQQAIRVQTAQQVSGESAKHWDHPEFMDLHTADILSYAGLKCRILGTFYVDKREPDGSDDDLILRFGADISNYYPNMGLKVFKPKGEALARIVNYWDPLRDDLPTDYDFTIGRVRYASTHRSFQGIEDVPVQIHPADLLGQKTALFGMTRTGKSNTTKILVKSVFDLRYQGKDPVRIGQLVFDPNGEYANENVQDANAKKNPSAIRNLATAHPSADARDVVTYGMLPHPNDPQRQLLRLNFFEEANLQLGKEILDNLLLDHKGSLYIKNFRNVAFVRPDPQDRSAVTRFRRRVLVYRALLARAGFDVPDNVRSNTQGLFNAQLIQALAAGQGRDPGSYASAAQILQQQNPSWQQLATAFEHLNAFMEDPRSGYGQFDQAYVQTSSSQENWADTDLKSLLGMFKYPNGARLLAAARENHGADVGGDYADQIYDDLTAGRLVVIDQSTGDPELNRSAGNRIMRRIFAGNLQDFTRAKKPPHLLVYVEEAHNLLPRGNEEDLQDIWVRAAKEGAKLNLGLVYSTQEVSSIQKNILKNTSNWFIGHLNNADEINEIKKYTDFEDFEASIRRAPDKGFLRVKTLSNFFAVPTQIDKFEV